jgi:hypothetical protein
MPRIPTNPADSRGGSARRRLSRASNPEWEIGDFGLQTGLGPWFPTAARAAEGLFGVGLRKQGRAARDETERPSRVGIGKGLKKEMVELGGRATFIQP